MSRIGRDNAGNLISTESLQLTRMKDVPNILRMDRAKNVF